MFTNSIVIYNKALLNVFYELKQHKEIQNERMGALFYTWQAGKPL